MEITEFELKKIKPYENNPRKKKDIEKVANSIKEYGWQQPIVIDENNIIIVGHSRYLAAKKLQMAKVPVVVAKNLTDEQIKGYRIADNKTNEYSEWDYELLHQELEKLMGKGFDLDNLGFGDKELDAIINFDGSGTDWLDTEKEWQDMPEFTHQDESPHRTIRVHFQNKEALETFFKIIKQDVTDKTKFIWFPKLENNVLKDKGYVKE